MGWKENQKENNGEATAYPDFLKHISKRFEIKGSPKGKISFTYYDRDKQEKMYLSNTMEGVLIGSAMKLQIFDSNENAEINSSVFFNYKDNGVAFSKGKVVVKGTMNDIKDYMTKTAGGCKNRRVYFVLAENGLYEITSNISFSIFEISRLEPGVFNTFMAKLTPTEYDPDNNTYDKEFKKILGPFASKNRPKFASISVGTEITDDIAAKYGLEEVQIKFKEWKKYTTDAGNTEIEGATRSEHDYDDFRQEPNVPPMSIDNAPPLDQEDDLPF